MSAGKAKATKDGAPRVVLHKLAGKKKALDACVLVERLYTAGKRVTVYLADAGRAAIINEYLWTFAQHSFVPHVLWDGQATVDDPVVVVTGALSNPNASDVLVVGDRLADPAQAAGWTEVHDLVTDAPEDEGKAAAWDAAGFAVQKRDRARGER